MRQYQLGVVRIAKTTFRLRTKNLISKNLIELRKQHGLSQRDLAREMLNKAGQQASESHNSHFFGFLRIFLQNRSFACIVDLVFASFIGLFPKNGRNYPMVSRYRTVPYYLPEPASGGLHRQRACGIGSDSFISLCRRPSGIRSLA